MSEQKSNSTSELPSTGASHPSSASASPEPSPNNNEESASTLNKSNPEAPSDTQPREIGGQKGPEPTRYGDWEKNGRCTDF